MNFHGSEGFRIKHPKIWDLIFNLAVISESVVLVDQKMKKTSEPHDSIHPH
jgi:hypothetical protein